MTPQVAIAINIALVVIPAALLYWFGLRPHLKETVTIVAMWWDGEPFIVAVREKMRGLKQRVLTVATAIIVAVVTMWDYIAPYLTGVDMGQILPNVPQWAWPIITAALLYLAQHFRDLAEKRRVQEEAEQEAAAAAMAAADLDVSAVTGKGG